MKTLMINQFGNLLTGTFHGAVDIISLVFAFIFLALIIYMLVRPYKETTKLINDVKVTKKKSRERSLFKCCRGYLKILQPL